MKKKVIIGILLVALVVVASFVGVHHHNQVQKQKAIAVEQAKEEKAKNLRFQKLQSEYDTAEKQIENALYPNADGTVPDDATMNQSRDGKKQELVAFEKKIKDKKLTAKEEEEDILSHPECRVHAAREETRQNNGVNFDYGLPIGKLDPALKVLYLRGFGQHFKDDFLE